MCFLLHPLQKRKLAFSDEYQSYSAVSDVFMSDSGVPALCQISKKDSGVYEVVLKDDRGKDTSTLNLTDQVTLQSPTQQ